jgi:serine/threonine protein kinase
MVDDSESVVRCYGITKDPETNNFMIVMEYAQNGSLRNHLNNKFNSFLKWKNKLFSLYTIAEPGSCWYS